MLKIFSGSKFLKASRVLRTYRMDPVANLVEAYELLHDRVHVGLRTQFGNAGRMHELQTEVREFCENALNVGSNDSINRKLTYIIQMRERLHPLDFISLQGSLSKMVESLQEAERNALEPAVAGIQVSARVPGLLGRPRVEIHRDYLEHLLDIRGPSELKDVFKCSARTIRRRAVEYGLRPAGLPVIQHVEYPDGTLGRQWVASGMRERSAISDDDEALDTLVASILAIFPGYGRCKLNGALLAQGYRVPRERLRASIVRVSGPMSRFTRRPIERRAYYVPAVNSLWHHDGNHGILSTYGTMYLY